MKNSTKFWLVILASCAIFCIQQEWQCLLMFDSLKASKTCPNSLVIHWIVFFSTVIVVFYFMFWQVFVDFLIRVDWDKESIEARQVKWKTRYTIAYQLTEAISRFNKFLNQEKG